MPTDSADTLYWLSRFGLDVFAEGAQQGDPNSWYVPLETILSKDYAAKRFELMRMRDPQAFAASKPPYPGSNHLTVVDRDGNVATLLHSVASTPWSNGLIVDGMNLWAGGLHFLRTMPKPGDRATSYAAPHIVFGAGGKPVLAGGSPGYGLIQNCVTNVLNILEFGMDIETSVHQPRLGGPAFSVASMSRNTVFLEADCGAPAIQDDVRRRGLNLELFNPWTFHAGSYDGVHIAADGLASACGDPRRSGAAEAL